VGEEEGLDEPQRPIFRRDYFGPEEAIIIVLILVIVFSVLLFLWAFGEWSP
jgi:hypothetical protein